MRVPLRPCRTAFVARTLARIAPEALRQHGHEHVDDIFGRHGSRVLLPKANGELVQRLLLEILHHLEHLGSTATMNVFLWVF